MNSVYRRLGQILIQMKIITHNHVLEARRVQMANPSRKIGEIMVELGHITQYDLEKALSIQQDILQVSEG
jgi:DNA polymerase III alpha subunit (gram-positive type)